MEPYVAQIEEKMNFQIFVASIASSKRSVPCTLFEK